MAETKHIEINLGKACNNKCMFCNTIITNPSEYQFTPEDKVKQELQHWSDQGYNSVGFLGGEITLYPNIIGIVSFANSIGYEHIYIVSNGRQYADKNFIAQLIEAGVTRFLVSIHGTDKELVTRISQVPVAFEQQIQGIRNLVCFSDQIQQPISVNIVINKLNYTKLVQIIKDLYDLGIRDYRFNFISLRGRAADHVPELNVTFTDLIPEIPKLIKVAELLKIHLAFGDIPFCIFNKIGLEKSIKYIGEFLDQVVDVSMFDFTTGDHTRFNWKQSKQNDLKQKMPFCSDCIYEKPCEGVWKSYLEHNGQHEFIPIQ